MTTKASHDRVTEYESCSVVFADSNSEIGGSSMERARVPCQDADTSDNE